MRAALPTVLPLICPACRTRGERGWEMHTVELIERFSGDGDEIDEGLLACVNCTRRYPIVDGIPILVPHLDDYLRSEITSVVERDLSPALAAHLAAGGPDGDHYPRLVEHLSIYTDAHFGDRASPPPDGPAPSWAFRPFAEKLAARSGAPVERAVELGCGLGRGLLELAPTARRVVGVDLHFGALRRARRLLDGQPLSYARRVAGRNYVPATVSPGPRVANVALICGDALDPPLAPRAFDRVCALNLLDSVRTPATLLAVLDGLCSDGGELLLASPYAWQSGIVDEESRLGGADPAAKVRAILGGGEGLSARYTVEDEAQLPWALRRDARSAVHYNVDYLRVRRR